MTMIEACPLLPSVPIPIVVAPFMRSTVPVGMVAPEVLVTVAVKVIGWPAVPGLGDAVTDVVVDVVDVDVTARVPLT